MGADPGGAGAKAAVLALRVGRGSPPEVRGAPSVPRAPLRPPPPPPLRLTPSRAGTLRCVVDPPDSPGAPR